MSDPATSFETWGGEQTPVTIEYSLVVLDEIRQEVQRGVMKFSRGGIEVGGLLFGTRDGNKIRIEAMRTIRCDHASGPAFVLSAEDRVLLEQQLAGAATDAHLQNFACLGWFVSHTRGEQLALTAADQELFAAHFKHPWQVALVIRPVRGSQLKAAFFVWEPDGTVRPTPYQEFDFPDRLAGVLESPPRMERPAPRPTAPPPNPPPARPEPAAPRPMPVFESSQYYPSPIPERRTWPWVVGVLAILIVVAVVGMRFFWQPLQQDSLGLVMTEREGELQVEWNSGSRSVLRATRGLLLILDGADTERVPLTRAMLTEGRYAFARKSGDIEVRMEVETTRGTLRETSRFLGRPAAAAPASDGRSEELEAQRAALEAEVNRLKAQNAVLYNRVQQLERTQRLLESRLGIVGEPQQ